MNIIGFVEMFLKYNFRYVSQFNKENKQKENTIIERRRFTKLLLFRILMVNRVCCVVSNIRELVCGSLDRIGSEPLDAFTKLRPVNQI